MDMMRGYGPADIIDLEFNPFLQPKKYIGNNYEIASRIQRLRLRLLIHSCVYYEMNTSRVSDQEWDSWAYELKELQHCYPDESRLVVYYHAFKDWDATTGFLLPIRDAWVMRKTKQYLEMKGKWI